MFISLFKHDCRVFLFLSWSTRVRVGLSEGSVLWNHLCQTGDVQDLSVSGQLPDIRGCFSPSHTLSTRHVGLHCSKSSIVKFTLNSQFLHFWCVFVICFSLEANMQARDPPFLCSSQNSYLWSRKPRFPLPMICLLGNDKVLRAVHVLQKRHINTEDWLSRELSASKLRKGSSFWEASPGSSPHTVVHPGSNFACKWSLQIHNFWNL